MQSLLELLPSTSERRTASGALEAVPVSELRIADVILVRPGAALPADGVVVSGSSFVKEAAITGEPLYGSIVLHFFFCMRHTNVV